MDRRAYLTGVAAAVSVTVAGCLGDDGNGDDGNGDDGSNGDDGDGEVILQETVAAGSPATGGGNFEGGGGAGGGDVSGAGGGLEGAPGGGDDGDDESDGPLPDGGTSQSFQRDLQDGDQIEIRISNEGGTTGFQLFAPNGDVATADDEPIQGQTDGDETFTYTVEQDGEYDLVVSATNRATVRVTKYPADDQD